MKSAPESRHLRPAEKLLAEVLGGRMQKHPTESDAARDSRRVEMLGWKPKEEWKR